MNNRKQVFYFSILAAASVITAFTAGYFTHAWLNPTPEDLPVLNQAYEILKDHAYDELPENPALEYGMIRGMIQAFNDPFTLFVEPVQHELNSDNLEGRFGGIGVRIVMSTENTYLLYPFQDSPAAQSGVLDGDQLMAVDELLVGPEISRDEIQAAIRGPVGTRVELTLLRPLEDETIVLSIKREEFSLPSVSWHLVPSDPKVGIIEVNILAASTPEEVERAATDLKDQGANQFLLDLRENNGGLLEAGIDTARLFLREGVVIEQQYRGQDVETFRVRRPGPLAEIPLVVLVNENTASAAEIVAGAIQSHNRAPLVGSSTFGKDSIQLVFELIDASSLHVTAARWWIPELNPPLSEGGLQPSHQLVDEGDPSDQAVNYAVQILQESTSHPKD